MRTLRTEVIEAREEHCAELAAALDDAGRELIREGWDIDPEAGLRWSWAASDREGLCWTVLVDGEVAAMFGCIDRGDGTGFPWLTTAPAMERVKLRFIRQSRAYLDRMLARFPRIEGWAHEENKALIGWLKWAGFTVGAGRLGRFLRCVCQS